MISIIPCPTIWIFNFSTLLGIVVSMIGFDVTAGPSLSPGKPKAARSGESMPKVLTGENAKKLCLLLLNSDEEEDVVEILKREGYWNDPAAWRPYGGIKNNRGVVGNQQSSPVAALVEKIVNSIDAVLTGACLAAGVDPTGEDAPKSMTQAVEEFFDVRGGKIQTLSAIQRTALAENIQLVAVGSKDRPCYLIIDTGEGQTPDQFPDTFLSLLHENKSRIPFVQGKFNMGGTGVLQFSGTHSFQLIVSRRQPDIGSPNSDPSLRNSWGFTLIRRLDPGPDQPQSTYVYLDPGGRIPCFDADSLPLLPGRYPERMANPLEAGTCIKLWHYKLPGLRTLATLDLRYALQTHLQDPALPIRISERRTGYRANYYDTTMAGLSSVLEDSRQDIETGFDNGSTLKVPGVGDVDLRLVVVSDAAESGSAERKFPSGMFFNINGQLHGERNSQYIERRTKLAYVADTMIVMVDCTRLPVRVREDLFMGSRDRMRICPELTALEEAILTYLKDHPGLRELNARRRQVRLERSLSENETAKIIQDLVRADPTLANLFGKGQAVKVPVGPVGPPEKYVGKEYPTFFRLTKQPAGGLVKQCAKNRFCRVEFETDATNDFFSRVKNKGSLKVTGSPQLIGGVHLWNGRATVRLAPPETCSVGDLLKVKVAVSDVSRTEPFESSLTVEVMPEVPEPESGTTGRTDVATEAGGGALAGLPNIIEVRQDKWEEAKFNENSALAIKHGNDDGAIDIYVNMDNLHLRNEIARRRDMSPEILQYWFKYGLLLLALGMLYRDRQRNPRKQEVEGEERALDGVADDGESISKACEGLAITVIATISGLNKGK